MFQPKETLKLLTFCFLQLAVCDNWFHFNSTDMPVLTTRLEQLMKLMIDSETDLKGHVANALLGERMSRPNVIDHIQFQTRLCREESEPRAKGTAWLSAAWLRSAQYVPSSPLHSV